MPLSSRIKALATGDRLSLIAWTRRANQLSRLKPSGAGWGGGSENWVWNSNNTQIKRPESLLTLSSTLSAIQWNWIIITYSQRLPVQCQRAGLHKSRLGQRSQSALGDQPRARLETLKLLSWNPFRLSANNMIGRPSRAKLLLKQLACRRFEILISRTNFLGVAAEFVSWRVIFLSSSARCKTALNLVTSSQRKSQIFSLIF